MVWAFFFNTLLILPLTLAALTSFAGCGKDTPASGGEEVWSTIASFEFPELMRETRIAKGGSFYWQLQPSTGAHRVAVISNSKLQFELKASEQNGTISLTKDGTLVGVGRAIAPAGPALVDTRGEKKYFLDHLCQFSDPDATRVPYFQRVCEVQFHPVSGLMESVRVRPATEIEASDQDDQVYLSALSDRLDGERKELEDQVKRLKERIRNLEGNAATDVFLQEIEQKMDALRAELKLTADATPEQIGAAVARQGVLISQFSREISDLKKSLELPKNASFEDVLKALKEVRKRDGATAEPTAERKEPPKSPIN